MFSGIGNPQGFRDSHACEWTVRYVFGLIWPQACIDCSLNEDCYLVGVREGAVRHVVCVPCSLVQFGRGLTLVRAVYRAGLPREFCRAASARSFSL
jgi:hypothetical protein